MAEAVRRAGVRWKIEENNEAGKQVTGLGQHQVRRWDSWHRHVTCAMLALAFLTVQRARHPGSDVEINSHPAPWEGNPGKAQASAGGSTCRSSA